MKSLIFATSNAHKAQEVSQILNQENLEFKTLQDIKYNSEIEETGQTLTENALIKARTIHELTGENVFADDSGLEVWALNMAPGVHTARYAGEHKNAGDNMDKLLSALKGKENRKARFRAVIALIWGGQEELFEGIVNGEIALTKSGEGGFGYDPVFIPENYSVSFAHLSDEIKNTISHRFKAVNAMKNFLEK